MKKIALICTCLVIFGSQIAFAQAASPNASSNSKILPDDNKKAEVLLGDELMKKLKRGTFFVLGIEDRIKSSSDELSLLKNNVRALENKIIESKIRVSSLESQISNLDLLINQNREKIYITQLQIAQYENGIDNLKNEIGTRETFLKNDVKSLDKILLAYYTQTNLYFDISNKEPSLLAFLSSDSSTGEIMQENEYLYFMQDASQELATKIIAEQLALDEKSRQLENKMDKVADLKTILTDEKNSLVSSQESRERLLAETKGKQIIYETLLELSRKEVLQVSDQIMRLKENYNFFQTKLDELRNNPAAFPFNPDAIINQDNLLKNETAPLVWPVSPAAGLSAFYHDTAYQKALGIQHNAVDIRIESGSKVKAAADGVVSKVIDNGYGYSYLILAHAGGLLTLYGHMSEMIVQEGEIVRQGQVIGLSGGIPGTKGAGWLTTGAHLHFEVFKNWQHTDPLEYLPLEFVPISSLPEKFVKLIMGMAKQKVMRAPNLSTLE